MKKLLPIISTRGLVVLPETELTIEIGRAKSIEAIKLAQEKKSDIIIATQIDPNVDNPKIDDIYTVGTLSSIEKINKDEKTGDYSITFLGKKAVNLFFNNDQSDEIPLTCGYEEINQNEEFSPELIEDLQILIKEAFDKNVDHNKKYFEIASKVPMHETITYSDYIKTLNNLIMSYAMFSPNHLIKALHSTTIADRQTVLSDIILKQLPNDESQRQVDDLINKKINESLSKQQKEFYLRERLRAIKEELKMISSRDEEIENIKRRLETESFPKHIREKILHEINKYEQANPNETSIIKSYIDWLINLPWSKSTVDNNNLNKVQEILDKNHYGIPKVKERIIEYLAVQTQNPDSKGPIICLVGPPGVGKTSLAKSIAEALDKVYVKVSLGGVTDESEIRGHRKTYLGAMPGRIIKGMKKSGVINPLFLLDEIDKMSSDFKGDPSSALLEVLDPEQNSQFSDNYIEEEYDLSKVMFVATANYYNQIPEALIDRLEIIELSSYTPNEKLMIAKSHLIKKVLSMTNLTDKDIEFTDNAINHMINYYARESGVRELQRLIEKIVRKYLVEKLKSNTSKKQVIDIKEVELYLGKKRFDLTLKDKTSISGIVNGMAYTSAGGDLLPIEVTHFKGKGDLIITGNLEQTMNESASVALGYVKANAIRFGIDPELFKNNDIHIHVPAGGIPKDGPSAGVTLTTALISSLTNTPVSTKISMTGEITLRGKVGIIGGVKEKVISAFRAGVNEIFLPIDDERFLEDVPNEIKDQITFHLVETYDDIYNIIFKNLKPFVPSTNDKNVSETTKTN